MKSLYPLIHLVLFALMLTSLSYAQNPPEVIWEDFYPGEYEKGNYTANDIKESPYGYFVITGGRNMTSAMGGYGEVMLMRVDLEGMGIRMNQIFTGFNDEIPWDQEAYDMIITPMPLISFLVTGYRDVTLTSSDTPPGLFLMQIRGDGGVLFDSLYYNNNLHHMAGRCIQPVIGGGYIIACSFRENGGGTHQTMVTRLVQNEDGRFVHKDQPSYTIIPAGQSGYASWIRQYGKGYLMGGTAFQNPNRKFDLFIQKLDANRNLQWTEFYGREDSDEFADAIIAGQNLYITGSAGVLVPGTSYYKDQIYIIKTDTAGRVIWEKTYGGTHRHYANKIMMTGEGDLLIAGTAYDQSMHTSMILMKIDAESGDSLWTQSYGSQFENAGIRDAIRTKDFGYLFAGRGSYTGSQDPRVYLMKLDHGDEREHREIPRKDMGISISPSAPAIDVINYTANADSIYGVNVMIDSLLHPSVGDLEITLSHNGTTVTLANRPVNSGENFIRTGFADTHFKRLDWDFAPYTNWYRPEDELAVFKTHKPSGDWTLSVIDFGSGNRKATTRVLEGWTLNLLTNKGSETGLSLEQALAGFGLENIHQNPILREAQIFFHLNVPGRTRLSAYNILGQMVSVITEETLPEGNHKRIWHPDSLPPGTYFIQLESRGLVSVRKVVLR